MVKTAWYAIDESGEGHFFNVEPVLLDNGWGVQSRGFDFHMYMALSDENFFETPSVKYMTWRSKPLEFQYEVKINFEN